MTHRTPTLDDVAKLASISKSTASRILSAEADASLPYAAETQGRVRDAARMLGYRPSQLARGLIRSQTHIIGLVVPTLCDSFFPDVVEAIEKHLATHGYRVILSNSRTSSTVEKEKIEDLLAWQVDGLIVAPSQDTADASLYWTLWQQKRPFVLIDRFYPDTPFLSVTTNDSEGARMAVEHLLSTGRRRIACVGFSQMASTNRLRHAGFVAALAQAGIHPDPSWFIAAPGTEEGGHGALAKILDLQPRPDAAFCFSDPLAAGLMDAALDASIRIPDELAIVGYADLNLAHLLRKPLTTVRQPREEIGQCAVELLLELIRDKTPAATNSVLPVELIVRGSS